jgi:hypothetical protein
MEIHWNAATCNTLAGSSHAWPQCQRRNRLISVSAILPVAYTDGKQDLPQIKVTAWICEGFICRAPLFEIKSVLLLIDE